MIPAWQSRRRSSLPNACSTASSRGSSSTRVLELAADESMPLLERVKFCSIFSSNLDEFFMVRVAGLMDQAASGLPVRSHDGLTPREALGAIRERVDELTRRAGAALEEGDLRPRSRRRASTSAGRGLRGAELAELDRALRARDLPGADAARRRAGSAVPVHLRALALASACSRATPTPARSASPASRCPSSCRGSSRSASGRCCSRSRT